jgi:hypothetical protein
MVMRKNATRPWTVRKKPINFLPAKSTRRAGEKWNPGAAGKLTDGFSLTLGKLPHLFAPSTYNWCAGLRNGGK